MNANGSWTPLTTGVNSRDGSFSPDGKEVVFSRFADRGLYVVDATGGTPQPIVKQAANVGSVAWSPDGSRIAYLAYQMDPPGLFEIWTVNPDGTDPRLLVGTADCGVGACSAGGGLDWSPDGSTLAFQATPPGSGTSSRTAIYVVRADGSGLRRINDDGAAPSWSPDGSRIAFTRYDGFNTGLDLFTMASDGSDATLVDGVVIEPGYVAWNPVSRP